MLFNSYAFICGFVPVVVLVFYLLGSTRRQMAAAAWLVAASLFFYGWWNPTYLILIIGSVCLNYAAGSLLTSQRLAARHALRKAVLLLGVGGNLAAIGYFKYANFFIENVNAIRDTGFQLGTLILPLGISFFTFQQIAFLIDSYRGQARGWRFLNYALFVTFFPQLIAGPIVLHKEMAPQFVSRRFGSFNTRNLAIGLAIFIIGLVKKVVVADGIATYASPIFDAAASGIAPPLLESWIAALAYTFQLYFDFSGYSDMAIGLARMFGIRLPLNFNSPFKSAGIIEFWQRWHMTLSRFLRDYLYIPLGGNRRGTFRRYINLLITMLLGGLWHGAGWTFIVWGGLHSFYLVVNHAWRALRRGSNPHGRVRSGLARLLSTALTFAAVVIAFVPFRADNLGSAVLVIKGMFGMNGVLLPGPYLELLNRFGSFGDRLTGLGIQFGQFPVPLRPALVELSLLMLVVWLFPNTQQIMARYRPALNVPSRELGPRWWQWRLNPACAIGTAALGVISLLHLTRVSEFLYFQF